MDAQVAEMLNRAPDLRAGGAQFFGDPGAADDEGCVVAEEANDVAETSIGEAFRRCIGANWGWASDRRIMREWERLGK
jgi:hypothetical protein